MDNERYRNDPLETETGVTGYHIPICIEYRRSNAVDSPDNRSERSGERNEQRHKKQSEQRPDKQAVRFVGHFGDVAGNLVHERTYQNHGDTDAENQILCQLYIMTLSVLCPAEPVDKIHCDNADYRIDTGIETRHGGGEYTRYNQPRDTGR